MKTKRAAYVSGDALLVLLITSDILSPEAVVKISSSVEAWSGAHLMELRGLARLHSVPGGDAVLRWMFISRVSFCLNQESRPAGSNEGMNIY